MTNPRQDCLSLTGGSFARSLIAAGALFVLTLGTSSASRGQTAGNPIPVGINPSAMVLNPAANRIYVANQGGSQPATTVSVINTDTKTSSDVDVGGTPTSIAVNPVANKIYVSTATSVISGGTVVGASFGITVLDGSTNNIIATIPNTVAGAMAVNPVTNKIYVASGCNGTSCVKVVDGATDTVEATPISAGTDIEAIAVNSATDKIYVANTTPSTLTVIDGATNQVSDTVTLSADFGNGPVSVRPNRLAVNPVTNKVYIGLEQGVMALDGATGQATQVSGPPLNGNNNLVTSFAINPITNKVYVGYVVGLVGTFGLLSNFSIGEIDGSTNQETLVPAGLAQVSPSGSGTEVAVNVFTNQVFIATDTVGSVTILDGLTHASQTVSVAATPVGLAVDSITNTFYVLSFTQSMPGSVQAISEVTTTIPTISTGLDPFAVAVDPVLNKIYVANDGSDDVTVIDGATNSTSTIPAGTNPFAVTVDPITGKAFVANQGSNTVTAIDGRTGANTTISVGKAPEAVAVNPVTSTVYVSNSGSNSVTVIDEATNATATVATGSTPVALAVNQATNRIYVADEGSNDVTVINGTTNTTSSIAVGSSPTAVDVNPATNKIYVANKSSNDVTVIDGATGTTSGIPVGTTPVAVAVNPVTNKIYVADKDSGDVMVINGSNNSVTPVVVGVGTLPYAIAVNLATNRVYVTDNGSNNVTVIDGGDNSTTTLPGGNGPDSVAVNPITGNVYTADIGDQVTVLTEQVARPTPLVTQITPFPGNVTTGPAPTFTFTTTSSYAPTAPPVVGVFYQVDTLQGRWLAAPGSGPTFIGQTPLTAGTHILYAFALDAQASLVNLQGEIASNVGQYITGSLTAYLFVVALPFTQTTLTSDKNPSQVGDTVNLTATVAPAASATGAPTGTVDFFDSTTLLDSVALDSKGNAVFTTSTLTAGTHQIVAKYEGNSTFGGSASAPVTQTVNENFTTSASPNALTITHGQSGTSILTITPVGGADTVAITFSCTGLPTGSTCAFSPASVTPGSNPATTTLTIQTAGSAAVPAPFDVPALPPGLIFLLVFAAALGLGTTLRDARRMRLRRVPAACLLASLALVAFTTGCGGGGTSGNPPPSAAPTGNFTVTVHATAGSVDKTTTITLTVN